MTDRSGESVRDPKHPQERANRTLDYGFAFASGGFFYALHRWLWAGWCLVNLVFWAYNATLARGMKRASR